MDYDQIHEDTTFNFGTINYKDVIITREYIKSSGFMTTQSHKDLYKRVKSGHDQHRVAYSNFKHKTTKPHSSIVLFHGTGEHSQRYNFVCYKFALDGYDVHTVDFRCFGRSGGARGSVYDLAEYHEDMIACLKRTKNDLPLFLFGHSMGGGCLLSFLINNPQVKPAGVILSGPFNRTDCWRQNCQPFPDQVIIRGMRYVLGHIYTTFDIGSCHLFRREKAQDMICRDTKMFP